ncbi:MAG: glycosyltransferase [Gemmataceae bacterium]
MDIVALVESERHVCCRYRLLALAPWWQQAGYRLRLRPVPKNWVARRRVWVELAAADAVILQRRLFSWFWLSRLRRRARRLFFDFDDAVFLRDSYSRRGLLSRQRLRRFAATVRAADVVVAGNPFLAAAARRYATSAQVHIVPTCVDPQRYRLASQDQCPDEIRLVWIGSHSTVRCFQMCRELMERIGQALPHARLYVICDRFPQFDHLPVIPVPWSESSEVEYLARAHIGISWLPDDDWSRGKCGLKILQYLAAGLPVVANPVGEQARLVRPGVQGFLADHPQHWIEALTLLAQRPDLRRHMGLQGRKLVEASYSTKEGAERWLRIFRHAASWRPAA